MGTWHILCYLFWQTCFIVAGFFLSILLNYYFVLFVLQTGEYRKKHDIHVKRSSEQVAVSMFLLLFPVRDRQLFRRSRLIRNLSTDILEGPGTTNLPVLSS